MGWIVAIILGALIGWIASLIMNTDEQQGTLANILIGIVGSLLGSWIFGGLLGIGGAWSAGSFSFWGIVWGIIGAIVLIAILKSFKVFR